MIEKELLTYTEFENLGHLDGLLRAAKIHVLGKIEYWGTGDHSNVKVRILPRGTKIEL